MKVEAVSAWPCSEVRLESCNPIGIDKFAVNRLYWKGKARERLKIIIYSGLFLHTPV